jgi:hypothetical protein
MTTISLLSATSLILEKRKEFQIETVELHVSEHGVDFTLRSSRLGARLLFLG